MERLFVRMSTVLGQAWPSLSEVDWTLYGTNLRLVDDSGVRKYQGVMLHSILEERPSVSIVRFGSLPDVKKTAVIVGTKIALLKDNPQCMASMELRNPEEGKWGGGIRASGHRGLSALSGLPEVGDHLVLAHLMRHNSLLTLGDWKSVLDHNQAHLQVATAKAGMSAGQYTQLSSDIFRIVEHANSTVPWR
jgi:hypothetical protein